MNYNKIIRWSISIILILDVLAIIGVLSVSSVFMFSVLLPLTIVLIIASLITSKQDMGKVQSSNSYVPALSPLVIGITYIFIYGSVLMEDKLVFSFVSGIIVLTISVLWLKISYFDYVKFVTFGTVGALIFIVPLGFLTMLGGMGLTDIGFRFGFTQFIINYLTFLIVYYILGTLSNRN